jgi:hypothetical protein
MRVVHAPAESSQPIRRPRLPTDPLDVPRARRIRTLSHPIPKIVLPDDK